jgi:DNA-binding NtrC family response regulator
MIEAAQVLPGKALEQASVEAQSGAASSQALPTDLKSPPATLEELERQHILRVLEETGGNRERAAAILGISARTLYRKLREYETGAKPTGGAGE